MASQDTPNHCILGIDPGLSGAAAFYFPAYSALIAVEDLPIAGGEIDSATLARRFAQMAPTLAVIERVGAMPKQGISSTFRFGVTFGMIRAVVSALGVPTHLVAPSWWKKHFRPTRTRTARWRYGSGLRASTSRARKTTDALRPPFSLGSALRCCCRLVHQRETAE